MSCRPHCLESLPSLLQFLISLFHFSICTGFSESKELKWLQLVPLENVTKTIRNYSQIKKLWCNLAADNRIHRLLTSTLMFFWAMFTDFRFILKRNHCVTRIDMDSFNMMHNAEYMNEKLWVMVGIPPLYTHTQ